MEPSSGGSNNNNNNNANKYDPNVIIQAANDKYAAGDLEGGQLMFQSALLQWVDDAREGSASGSASHNNNMMMMMDRESMQSAIATLWLAYAHYLIHAKQYKSAMEAYEQAVSCPIAKSVGHVWLQYARFAQERRQKIKTAQDIYIRALVGDGDGDGSSSPPVTDEQDRNLLWMEFLEMMQTATGKEDLTLDDLKRAAMERSQQKQQQQQQQATVGLGLGATDPDGGDGLLLDSTANTTTTTTTSYSPLANHHPPTLQKPAAAPLPAEDFASRKTHVVTAESVQEQVAALLDALLLHPNQQNQQQASSSFMNRPSMLPPDMTAAWMSRDGQSMAQPPEPPLFSPSPPKLSDPTGKDMLGIDLSIQLMELLIRPTAGSLVLEVCRALWTAHALKERETHTALDHLDQSIISEMTKLESSWEARLATVTAPQQAATRAAVMEVNHRERLQWETSRGRQRQDVLQSVAWEFRHLLWVQQTILTELSVPLFDGPTVEATQIHVQAQICSYLHSAFYLRHRIGEQPHVTMLESQLKRLRKEQQQHRNTTNSPIPPSSAAATGQPYMTTGGGRLTPPPASSSSMMHQHQQQQQPPPPFYGGMPPQQQQQPSIMATANGMGGYPPQQQQQLQPQPHSMMLPMQQQPHPSMMMMQVPPNMPPPGVMGGGHPIHMQQQQQQPPPSQQQQQPPYGGGGGAAHYPPYY